MRMTLRLLGFLACLFFVGFSPPPSGLMEIRVLDILTRQPIPWARVEVEGLPVLGFADEQGIYRIAKPPAGRSFWIKAHHARYMGTMETSVETQARFEIAMPPLDRLEEADLLIRTPRPPHIHQARVEMPTSEIPRSPEPLAPTRGQLANVTYPMPATIQVDKGGGQIVTMPLEEYLKGVLPKEIGSSFPLEAQKAQAVAARTYTVNYTRGGTRPICITTTCQVWGTTRYASTDQAVDETKAVVAVYNGSLAGGYFAASCGGTTRSNKDAGWSSTAVPYLKAVTCIENKTGACTAICVGQPNNSSCWGVYGHRVGLCQRGAQAMAKCGKTFDQIVTHYYSGVDLANLAATSVDDGKLISEDLPPGTKVQTGASVSKRWTLENSGTTSWTSGGGYTLIRSGGTQVGPASLSLQANETIAPAQRRDFTFTFNAPSQAGPIKATWQMDVKGKRFGPVLSLDIVVETPPDCTDKDGDGYGVGPGCTGPQDCNDDDPTIHPGAKEVCGDGKDNDCKDGDATCPAACEDKDKDGYFAQKNGCPEPFDCDDNDPKTYPGAPEICGDGKDNDCSSGDLACPAECVDKDGDGYGVGAGCKGPQDCNDNDPTIHPGAREICGDGKDNDCKEGDATCPASCEDKDKDGYFAKKDGCPEPFDCDDNDPTVNPGEIEVCGDGKDNDCSGGDAACGSQTSKNVGESCASHGDCKSGLCIKFEETLLCSTRCEENKDCLSGSYCLQQTACWPQKKSPASPSCTKDSECAAEFSCFEGVCRATPRPQGCGCSSAGLSASGLSFLVLAFAFFFLFLLRRPAQG